MRNFAEQQTGIVKSRFIRQDRRMSIGRQAAVVNGEGRGRAYGMKGQFLMVAAGMLTIVSSGFDEMCPDEIQKSNGPVFDGRFFRPVLGIVFKYVAHLGQLTEVHAREQTPDEEVTS